MSSFQALATAIAAQDFIDGGNHLVVFAEVAPAPLAVVAPTEDGGQGTSAFSFEAVGGGVFGYAIMVAMKNGFARGVFSNEAGLGSA